MTLKTQVFQQLAAIISRTGSISCRQGPARPPAKKDLRIFLTARNAIARLAAVKGRHLRKACIPGVATEKPLKRRFKKLPSVWFSAGDSLWIANICAALRF
jgi:hypothetical protein